MLWARSNTKLLFRLRAKQVHLIKKNSSSVNSDFFETFLDIFSSAHLWYETTLVHDIVQQRLLWLENTRCYILFSAYRLSYKP